MKKYINPYKLFVGSLIPNWLLQRSEVSPGAKLCYARLCQYAGKDGICYPKQTTLAQELGCSRGQVIRYLKQLLKCELIEIERIGLKCSNRYYFLEHEWMHDDMTDIEYQNVTNALHQEVTDASHQEVLNKQHPIERELEERESEENIKTDVEFLYKRFRELYQSTYKQPYIESLSGKPEEQQVRSFYEKFVNLHLWFYHSSSQVEHCSKIIELFFKEGSRQRWNLNLRNLNNKANRLQRLLTTGDDGVYRPPTEEEMAKDRILLKRALVDLEKFCDEDRIYKKLNSLPDHLHRDLYLGLSKIYPSGHSYTKAKDRYEENKKKQRVVGINKEGIYETG